ncbi:coiled-coil domain-containing protein 194 isoform X4 [Macaca fascicularis]|uniref:coiled-coil domain-containing protein 194 isoform X4 n=1 Tax=Macaca fascicularis TaxID=9541 RepID=UPI0032B0647C
MAEPGPEPGRAWRVLALCGVAVFLAAAAAGGALVAWNLAASAARGSRCPEPGANATAPPGDPPPEVDELRRLLAEAAEREEALARQLDQAESIRRELEKALKACEGRQSRLQTQLTTLKIEMDEAKAQETQMGAENGALTEALARWEAAATESARRLDEALRRAGVAEAEGEACAAREAVLRERFNALAAEMSPQRRSPRPRPRSGSRPRPSPRSRSRSGPSGGCRRPARRARGCDPLRLAISTSDRRKLRPREGKSLLQGHKSCRRRRRWEGSGIRIRNHRVAAKVKGWSAVA